MRGRSGIDDREEERRAGPEGNREGGKDGRRVYGQKGTRQGGKEGGRRRKNKTNLLCLRE